MLVLRGVSHGVMWKWQKEQKLPFFLSVYDVQWPVTPVRELTTSKDEMATHR